VPKKPKDKDRVDQAFEELFGYTKREPKQSPPAPPPAIPPEPDPPPDPPPDQPKNPMWHLDCGHWCYQHVPIEYPPDIPHKNRGPGSKSVKVDSVEDCPGCKTGAMWDPHAQTEKYRRLKPIPVHLRRTTEKEHQMGWPGYCCDDEGYYIGGIGNDCRHAQGPAGPRCPVHRRPGKLSPKDEP
jgi:hypothetical protein